MTLALHSVPTVNRHAVRYRSLDLVRLAARAQCLGDESDEHDECGEVKYPAPEGYAVVTLIVGHCFGQR